MKTIHKVIIFGNVIVIILLLIAGSMLYFSPSKTGGEVINGQIFDMNTREIIPNCNVSLEYIDEYRQAIEIRLTTTDENGLFTFNTIKKLDDFEEIPYQIRIRAWDDLYIRGQVLLNFKSYDKEVMIYLRPGGKISGRISNYDEISHEIFVSCYRNEYEQDLFPLELNDDGFFGSGLINPGIYHIFICSDQFIPTEPVAVEVPSLNISILDIYYSSVESDIRVHFNFSGDYTEDPYIVISKDSVGVVCFKVVRNNMTIALSEPGNYSLSSEGGGSGGIFIDYYELSFIRGDNYADIELYYLIDP